MKQKYSNTINQQWAKKRNYALWRVRGLRANVAGIRDTHDKVLVFHELVVISNVCELLDNMIDNWKKNNIPSKRDYKLNQK